MRSEKPPPGFSAAADKVVIRRTIPVVSTR